MMPPEGLAVLPIYNRRDGIMRRSADMSAEIQFENPVADASFEREAHQSNDDVDAGQSSSENIFAALQKASMEKHESNVFWRIANLRIKPSSALKQLWDTILLLFVIYSCIVEPYKVAFISAEEDESTVKGMFETVVDYCFWTDIVLTFWTGVDKGFIVIYDKKTIARDYFAFWFWIDIIATMNWPSAVQWLYKMGGEEKNVNNPFIKLTRGLKVFRLARMSRLVSRLTAGWTIHTGFIEATTFLLYVVIVSHLLGCAFFLWPGLFSCTRVTDAVAWGPNGTSTALQGQYVTYSNCVKGSWRESFQLTVVEDDRVCGNAYGSAANAVDLYASCSFAEMTRQEDAGGKCSQAERSAGLCGLHYPDGFVPAPCASCTGDCLHICQGSTTAPSAYYKNLCKAGARLGTVDCPWTQATTHENCVTADTSMASSTVDACAMSHYVKAVYWSVTTMTTIGYGDYSAKSELDMVYSMMAQVLGLAFFALLLDHISNVNDVIGAEDNRFLSKKNQIIQFLTNSNVDSELVHTTVRYLNYSHTGFANQSFDSTDHRFAGLSTEIKENISIAMFKPVLKSVHFFGHSESETRELEVCKQLFRTADVEANGALDHEEVKKMVMSVHLNFSEEEVDAAMLQMKDNHHHRNPGVVEEDEFVAWFYRMSCGLTPEQREAPEEFLDRLCCVQTTRAFGPGETILGAGGSDGAYGDFFLVILSGSVEVRRDGQRFREVTAGTSEPVAGLCACLNDVTFNTMRPSLMRYSVHAQDTFTDIACIKRTCLHKALNVWPEGRLLFAHQALKYLHDDDRPVEGEVDADVDADEIVDLQAQLHSLNERVDKVADMVTQLATYVLAEQGSKAEPLDLTTPK